MNARIAFALSLLVFAAHVPAADALAGEINAVINGKSFHLGASRDWNEENYGLGLEYQLSGDSRWKSRLMANGFRDSNDKMSYMAGGGLHRELYASDRFRGFYVEAGINAFLMTREDINDNRPFPGVLPSVTFGNDFVGMNLTYLPKKAVEEIYDQHMTDASISGIVFLQLKFSVNARD